MDTAILENKAAFSVFHDHQTFYNVCKKTQIVAKKATKCFMLTALTWRSSLTFLLLGVDKRRLCLWACAYAIDHNKHRSHDIFLEIWEKLPSQIIRGKPLRRVCAMMHFLTNNRWFNKETKVPVSLVSGWSSLTSYAACVRLVQCPEIGISQRKGLNSLSGAPKYRKKMRLWSLVWSSQDSPLMCFMIQHKTVAILRWETFLLLTTLQGH